MSGSKISIALAATALLVSVLFATPLGQAAGRLVIAQNSIGSKQVINGSLQTKDLSKKAVSALRGAQGSRGGQGVPGPQGIQGVQGVQGLPGTARAYGRIAADGSVSRSKNIASVAHPGTGIYCISLAGGIDSSQAGLVVSSDYAGDATSFNTNAHQSIAEWRSNASNCPPGLLEVITGYRTVTTAGSSDGDVRSVDNELADQAFFFVVP